MSKTYTEEELLEALGASLTFVLDTPQINPNVLKWAEQADAYFFPVKSNILDFATGLPVKYPNVNQRKYEPFKGAERDPIIKALTVRIQDLLNRGDVFGDLMLYNDSLIEPLSGVIHKKFNVPKQLVIDKLTEEKGKCEAKAFIEWLYDQGARP